MVAPSQATSLSFPLILLSLMEASTMDDSSSCVVPASTAPCPSAGQILHGLRFMQHHMRGGCTAAHGPLQACKAGVSSKDARRYMFEREVSPKTSGRARASPTRFRPISSSLALVVSLILASMASRWSFHLHGARTGFCTGLACYLVLVRTAALHASALQ